MHDLKDPVLDGGDAAAADCHWWNCLLQTRQLRVNFGKYTQHEPRGRRRHAAEVLDMPAHSLSDRNGGFKDGAGCKEATAALA